ncbi:MAG: energy-coupling factor ABC transporter ATP-binding protein [bacterium]|nr:energy-coupling factor ABC transporter ATP-binding protein [bacterium]
MGWRVVPMVTLQAVSYMLPNGRFLLKDISLQLTQHEKLALLGANGSGKTTLLHLLAGVLQPTSGSIIWEPTPQPGEVQLLLQNPSFQTLGVTVRDELAFGQRLLNRDETTSELAIEHSLARLQIPANRELTQLSGGELQQVVAEAVRIVSPRLLLCDEPAMYLPPVRRKQLQDELFNDSYAIVWVTPSLSEALSFPRIIALHEGKIVFDGNGEVLQTMTESLRQWQFVVDEVDK